MSFYNIFIIIRKELRDALTNQWVILYAISFTALALVLVWTTFSGIGVYRSVGFGKTIATLVNLIILIVPLMGLTLGAISISEEKDKGTLLYIMSQPISRLEFLLGKFFGLGIALSGTIIAGFGISGILIALMGAAPTSLQTTNYVVFVAFSVLLMLISLSLGFLISVLSTNITKAIGGAIFLWLFLEIFSDLGIMGTSLVLGLRIQELFILSLINPLQVFKISTILQLRANLDVLGPAGIYAVRAYGNLLLPFLLTSMIFFILIPFSLACIIFHKKGDI